jgi:hypothetical protein
MHDQRHMHSPVPIVPDLAVVRGRMRSDHIAVAIDTICPRRRFDCSGRW